jgi:hypothetical protein
MALTEQRTLNQVTILPNQKAASVQWADQILRDGVVVTETYHRCSYTEEQKSLFLTEVEGAESYLAALGWL